MTIEELENGVKLSEKIKVLENELINWKIATKIKNTLLYINVGNGNKQEVQTEYIDFDVLKTLTISRIEKELNELKQQFENL